MRISAGTFRAVPGYVGLLVFSLVVARADAQTGSAPSHIGLQPNRDYLALQPFEAIDTATGNLILRFEDLRLPGNNGLDLVVERAYNAYTKSWGFGISGVPMRVEFLLKMGLAVSAEEFIRDYPELYESMKP